MTHYNCSLLLVVNYKFAQNHKQIQISGDTTVADLIKYVLKEHGLESTDIDNLMEHFYVTYNGEEIPDKTGYVAEYGWPRWDKQFVISKPFNMK